MLIAGLIAVVAALIVAVVFAATNSGGGERVTTAPGTEAPGASSEATEASAPTEASEPGEVTTPSSPPGPPTTEFAGPTFPGFSIPSLPTFPELSLPETPETLAPRGSIPPATETPEGLGDDPHLDALARDCYDGDMDACDQLYGQSEAGSDYETYGDTCAGRQDRSTGQYCSDSFPS